MRTVVTLESFPPTFKLILLAQVCGLRVLASNVNVMSCYSEANLREYHPCHLYLISAETLHCVLAGIRKRRHLKAVTVIVLSKSKPHLVNRHILGCLPGITYNRQYILLLMLGLLAICPVKPV